MNPNFTDNEIVDGLMSYRTGTCNQITAFLYTQNSKKIVHYVVNNNGSLEDGEDLFQETVITFINQVWHGKFRLQDDTRISTYLYTIAKNNWLKKIERDEKKDNWELQFTNNQPKGVSTPIDVMIESEGLKSSWTVFNKLGEICKGILTAYYRDNKTMEQIAIIFGFPTAQAAKARKFRCMQELRKILLQ